MASASVSPSISPSASLSPSASVSPSPSIAEESVRRDPRIAIERVACRAFRSSNQDDITGADWTKVQLNLLTYDLGTNFDNSVNYRFTVPVTGLYHIIGSVCLYTSVTADKIYTAGIYKNGALVSQGVNQASAANYITCGVSDELYLSKDEYIELFVYTSEAGSTVDIYGEAAGLATFLVVRLVTKEGVR